MTVDLPESVRRDPDEQVLARTALAAAEIGTWAWDAASGVVRWDERLESQFGLPPGGFAGSVEGWVALAFGPDRDNAIAELQRAVRDQTSCRLEHRVQLPDGTLRWIEARGAPVLGTAGEVTGLAGVSFDVTDRHRRQQRAELAHWREAVINRAGELLAESLDLTARLNALARVVMSELADCCAIHLVDDDGCIALAAVYHFDAAGEEALRRLVRTPSLCVDQLSGLGRCMATGEAGLFTAIEEVLFGPAAEDRVEASAGSRELSLRSAYCVPLNRGERSLGALTLFRTTDNDWTGDERELAQLIGRRAAVAAENALLYAREQSARQVVINLQHITAGLAAAASLEEVARIVIEDTRKAVDADTALVARLVDGRLDVFGSMGFDAESHPDERHPPLHADLPGVRAVLSGIPVFHSPPRRTGGSADGKAAEEQVEQHPDGIGPSASETFALLPLTCGARTLGALRLGWQSGRRLAAGDQEFMLSVAQQAASALERAALLTATESARRSAEDSHRRMTLLAEVTDTLSASLDVDAVLAKLAKLVVPRLADLCTVDLIDRPGEPPRLLAVAAITPQVEELLHLSDSYLPRRRNPRTMIGKALATGEPVLAARVTDEQLVGISICAEQARAYMDMELISGLVVPLIARGQVLGALSMFSTRASGRRYNADTVELMTELARRAALSVDNARMFTREHEAAETLQRSLLPELPELPELDFAARYLPAAAHSGVGGDLFDLFVLPDGATAIAIGDVMGHDMRAAAAMGQLRSVLRSYAWEGASPGVVLDRMDQLVQSFEMAQLASALYARLELGTAGQSRLLRYSNAGHLPPLLQHPDGSARFLEGGQSVLIGVPDGHPRAEGVEPMPPGSTLLLYTDGLLEVGHRPLEPGLEQLLAVMQAHDPAAGAEALCAEALATIAGQVLVDDVALLAVRLR